MPVAIPPRLRTRLDQWAEHPDRFTDDETSEHVLAAIDAFVRETSTPPDGNVDDRTADTLRTSLIVATAVAYHVPVGFLDLACQVSPPGCDAALDAIITRTMASVESLEDLEGIAGLAIAWIGAHGETPDTILEAAAQADPLTAVSWIVYLTARNRRHTSTQEEVVAADLTAGCPASLLKYLRDTCASEAAIRHALAAVDQERWQMEGRWGDLAAVAVFLAENGWWDWAHEWSGEIVDTRVPPMPTLAMHQHHHDWLGGDCWNANDASVFAPLALIDLLAGDHARAGARATRCTDRDDLGPLGWALAAHFAVTQWIQAQLESNHDARRAILKSITPRHTSAGSARKSMPTSRHWPQPTATLTVPRNSTTTPCTRCSVLKWLCTSAGSPTTSC